MNKSYLTNETILKLQKAYIHEIHNMLIYSEISSWLNVNGFKNLSKYYFEWSEEERNHSNWVKDFLESLNIQIKVLAIEEVNYNLDVDITMFAIKTLETEDITTNIYEELLDIAYKFEDSALLIQFLNKMLIEQIEETDKANNINDYIKNIGNNRALLQLFDNTFKG